jgi:hypothetical protein
MKKLRTIAVTLFGGLFGFLALNTCNAQPITEVYLNTSEAQNCSGLSESEYWSLVPLYALQENTHACLRTTIQLEQAQQGAWLRMSALASARIFWDGQLIAENGRPAANAQGEIPGQIDFQAYIAPDLMRAGSHDVRIELSTHKVGRDLHVIFYYLSLEPFQADLSLPASQLVAVGIMAALLVFSLLFLCLYGLYQHRPEYLIFASLCLSSALLLLVEKWRDLFNYSYDYHVLRLWCVLGLTYWVGVSLCALYHLQSRIKRLGGFVAICLLMPALMLVPLSFDAKCALIFIVGLAYCVVVSALSIRESSAINRINFAVALSALLLLFLKAAQFLEALFSYLALAIACVMTATLIRDMKLQRRRALNALQLELELLKKSLQPHFLMNSLTLLMEWVETQPKLALSFIEELAEEFRLLIRFSNQPLVDLEDELALCRHHLRIMSLRYEQNFVLELNGPLAKLRLPPAILHTQIENSFSHGPIGADTKFIVEVQTDGAMQRIRLLCPMSQTPQGSALGFGIGQKYIKARLEEHYGRRYSFDSYQADEQTWCTELELPCTS